MELQGSLPLSQEPSPFPYPEPDQSSSCPQCLFLKIHFNIILPSTPGLANQISVCSSPVSHTRQVPNPSHSPWWCHSNNTWWEVQIIKLLSKQSPLTCYLVPFSAKYLPRHSIFEFFCCLVISKRYYWRSLNIFHQSLSTITAKEQLSSISCRLPALGIGFVFLLNW